MDIIEALDEPIRQDELSAGLLALLGAVLLYVCVLFALWTVFKEAKPLEKKRSLTPAPVRWQPSQTPQRNAPIPATSAPIPQTPAETTIPPEPKAQPQSEPESPFFPPAPKTPSGKPVPRAATRPEGTKESEKTIIGEDATGETVQPETAAPAPKPALKARTRPLPSRAQSRARWFEESAAHTDADEDTDQEDGSPEYNVSKSEKGAKKSPFFALNKVLAGEHAHHQSQWMGEEVDDFSLPRSAETQVRLVGLEFFLNRFIHTVCDASRLQPLRTEGRSVAQHIIIARVTIDKNRKVTGVAFPQPSPHGFINAYIERLIGSIVAPKLPANHQEDVITFNVKVRIEIVPEVSEITLIPIGD